MTANTHFGFGIASASSLDILLDPGDMDEGLPGPCFCETGLLNRGALKQLGLCTGWSSTLELVSSEG